MTDDLRTSTLTHERKTAQALILLPFLGMFLFCPPVILIFSTDYSLFSIPVIVIALFSIWAFLIGAAFCLSKARNRPPES